MKDPLHLTPAEFGILEHLWNSPASLSVGQVLKRVQRQRKVAYTTVMTLLDKMARKGSVRRVKQGKAYLYRPAVQRARVQAYLLDDFAASYFGGDLRRLAGFLDSNGTGSPGPAKEDSRAESHTPDLDVTLL